VVGFNAGEQLKLSTFNPVQLNFQRASRAPVGCIQYVCGQSSHSLMDIDALKATPIPRLLYFC
jgi:hypothetical protein